MSEAFKGGDGGGEPKSILKDGSHGSRKGQLSSQNQAGYTATPVVCGWAGAVFEVTRSFGQEQ